MIIDASALVALLIDEPAAGWVEAQLLQADTSLRISAVTFTEALIILSSRYGRPMDALWMTWRQP
jgi:uncharacterized protein with PIN domain